MNPVEGIQLLHGTVFKDEKVHQLLIVLTRLADQLLDELHAVAKTRGGQDSKMVASVFLKGLDLIGTWDRKVQDGEVAKACAQYPALHGLYKHSLVQYVKDVHKSDAHLTVELSIPPLREFYIRFFTNLALQVPVRSMKWFTIWGMKKHWVVVETVRATLFDCTKSRLSFRRGNTQRRDSIDHDIQAREQQVLAEISKSQIKVPRKSEQPNVTVSVPEQAKTQEPEIPAARPSIKHPEHKHEETERPAARHSVKTQEPQPQDLERPAARTSVKTLEVTLEDADSSRTKKQASKVIYTDSK